MEVTLGGQRLGAGGQRKQELPNYGRSTHNQEQDWKSTMAPGVLYPFLCIPMTNGDSMDIDLDAFVRTLPTKGPLFGSFKLQADIFSVPMRLYSGILHNNPVGLGMKMKQVYTPKIVIGQNEEIPHLEGSTPYNWQISNNCLLKYLGLSGIGHGGKTSTPGVYVKQYTRAINAVPLLGYYDIFKNYYANKQEENAYVITPTIEAATTSIITSIAAFYNGAPTTYWTPNDTIPMRNDDVTAANGYNLLEKVVVHGENLNNNILMQYWEGDTLSLNWFEEHGKIRTTINEDKTILTIEIAEPYYFIENALTPESSDIQITSSETETINKSKINLQPFALENIDKMRQKILSKNELGYEFRIGYSEDGWNEEDGAADDGLPYSANFKQTGEDDEISWNAFALNGLCVKTYQADLFQNWIQTDWIDGENGIAAISAVDVSAGSLMMDALNMAQKVYNMLTRVAISGGTWEDYQEAVWTEDSIKKAETPIYEGGMSAEIMFEEVIQSAETSVEGDFQALGALGGKGTMVGQKGGRNIHVKAREPIFVMGIVSITPRICYTQGNEWYLTELNSFDDLHKPAFDQIGFQDLIIEQFAWWDTGLSPAPYGVQRHSAGKVVAWSNYMTAVDKAFGDFAEPEGKGFMVLARNYEISTNGREVEDVTTYIDPSKFNYAFAYTELAAQNFWVQLHSRVISRRIMSAHQIPNL